MGSVGAGEDISTVGDIPRYHGKTRPQDAAIYFEGQRLSYGDLDRRTNQIANALLADGVRRQARVAILSKNSPAFFELWFGAAKANVVLVPVNFRLAPPEVAYVVEHARAELLFVGADFYPLVHEIAHELKSVRRFIALDGPHAAFADYNAWVAGQSEKDPAAPVLISDCAIQLYTSGTTGHPKGAQLSHANLLTLLPGALRQFGAWHENDVSLVCMPLFHIGGSGWALVGLYRGVENVLMRDPDPVAILRLIPERRITKAFLVPALLLFLLQAQQCQTTDFSSLELILYGASPAPIDLLRNALKVFGCDLAQLYGLTETTGAITYLPPRTTASMPSSGSNRAAGRWSASRSAWLTLSAQMWRSVRSGKSFVARPRSCSVTGTRRRRQPSQSATVGSILVMPVTSTRTATSSSMTV
jgi:long-chain acyl-CoA synthetase